MRVPLLGDVALHGAAVSGMRLNALQNELPEAELSQRRLGSRFSARNAAPSPGNQARIAQEACSRPQASDGPAGLPRVVGPGGIC